MLSRRTGAFSAGAENTMDIAIVLDAVTGGLRISVMIKGFIFDLDGTLLDTEMLWVEATAEFLEENDLRLPFSEVMSVVYGRGWHDVYNELCRLIPALDTDIDTMEKALSERMNALRENTDSRITSSVELLKKLAAEYPICIVSGSPRADVEHGIKLMGVEECLRFFLGSEDYSPGKPSPACFLKAATMLSLPPEDCLVFEDSNAGVAAAKAAHMTCVALARPDAPIQDVSAADIRLTDLARFSLKSLEEEQDRSSTRPA